jgi:hypothetical protein
MHAIELTHMRETDFTSISWDGILGVANPIFPTKIEEKKL